MKNQKTASSICILTIIAFGGLSVMASVGLTQEDTWTKKTDMPTARYLLSTSVVDGKIYAIGGRGPLSTVEEYGTGFVPEVIADAKAKRMLATTWGRIKRG